MRTNIVSNVAAIFVLALLARSALGQQQMPSYRPSSPTLSPYLYLTRPNNSPFPNYQSFVQPLQAQRQTNNQQQNQIIQLQQGQQQLQEDQFKPAAVAPTGVGSTFNSLSHFYQTGATGAPPPRAAQHTKPSAAHH